MKEFEKKFYFLVGKITIGFSNLESSVTKILSLLIDKDNDLLTSYLTDRQSIYRQLDLIRKISKFRVDYFKKIHDLLTRIDKLRIVRNSLIHGDWKIEEVDGEIKAVCDTKTVDLDVELGRGRKLTRWRLNDYKYYTNDQLLRTYKKINTLNYEAKNIISKMEEDENLNE